ncbi:sugar phosphate isomerase [Clostridia bacterium]|nr:sugar phosphate isomerase [Clostridia bacterium]
MKLGISSYCLDSLIQSGKLTLRAAIDWAVRQGAELLELVPFAFTFETDSGNINYDAIADVRRWAADAGIELANYSVLADLCKDDPRELAAEIGRVKRHIDIAAALGLRCMRHDISAFRRPRGQNGVAEFDRLLPQMADAAGELADHAAACGVTTLVENHGFFVNGCDRIERLIRAVDRPNFALLLDTGNIACVDEIPEVGALRLTPLAKMIHLKDFYIRRTDPGDAHDFDCAGSWFQTQAGRYLRGSILGQGDLDIVEILSAVKHSGYDGAIAIEFEGLEEPQYATKVSLDNARRFWDSIV